MSDKFPSRPLERDSITALVASVGGPSFGDQLLAYVRAAAPIANIGAFLVPDMARPEPVLSLWAGDMSGYWFNRNARRILSHDAVKRDIVSRIRAAAIGDLSIERWRPAPDDPLAPIYQRDEVIERVTLSSRTENAGFLSFYLRGQKSGWFSDAEIENLTKALPMAHELIGLRHRIAGSEAFHYSLEARVTALKQRDVGVFGLLSPREAQVCDQLLNGVSVAGTAVVLGISDNSVRTLRKRAYAKLRVHSAIQIAALVLNATP